MSDKGKSVEEGAVQRSRRWWTVPHWIEELRRRETIVPLAAAGVAGLARFHRPKEEPLPLVPPDRPQDLFTWFFALTGFQVLCVAGGIAFAAGVAIRLRMTGNVQAASVSLAGTAAYWQTVCAVWVILFLLLYGTG